MAKQGTKMYAPEGIYIKKLSECVWLNKPCKLKVRIAQD